MTPATPEEFAGSSSLDLEFGIGVVRGSRSFRVNGAGALTGVAHPAIWAPGENTAMCLRGRMVVNYAPDTRTLAQRVFDALTGFRPMPAPVYSFSWPTSADRDENHDMEACKCGFYGYYDGSNDFYQPGMVSGVVEGYGKTLIGSRGFRCTKARIVALHIPIQVPPTVASLVRRNYPNVPFFPSFDVMVAEYPPDKGEQ